MEHAQGIVPDVGEVFSREKRGRRPSSMVSWRPRRNAREY